MDETADALEEVRPRLSGHEACLEPLKLKYEDLENTVGPAEATCA